MRIRTLFNLKNLGATKLPTFRLSSKLTVASTTSMQKRASSSSTSIVISTPNLKKVEFKRHEIEVIETDLANEKRKLKDLMEKVALAQATLENHKDKIKAKERYLFYTKKEMDQETKIKISPDTQEITGDLKPDDLKIAKNLFRLIAQVGENFHARGIMEGEFDVLNPKVLKITFLSEYPRCPSRIQATMAIESLIKLMKLSNIPSDALSYDKHRILNFNTGKITLQFSYEQCLLAMKHFGLTEEQPSCGLKKSSS